MAKTAKVVEVSHPHKVGDTWYQFKVQRYACSTEIDDVYTFNSVLEETQFTVTKVTPKGVWLAPRHPFEDKHFVRISAVKRMAYASREEALTSLQARKRAQMRILAKRLDTAQKEFNMVALALMKLKPSNPSALAA